MLESEKVKSNLFWLTYLSLHSLYLVKIYYNYGIMLHLQKIRGKIKDQ